MSTKQDGGPALYWHGGRPGVQRGAFLLPPSITKTKHCGLYGAAGIHRTDRVYVATEYAAAVLYAAAWPGGVVYQCEPIGGLTPDPDCSEPGLSWECEKARVRKVVKLTQAERSMALRVLFEGHGDMLRAREASNG